MRRLAETITAAGAVAGIQLAHAGAKASREEPWRQRRRLVPPAEGGWVPVAESPRDDGEVRVLDDDEFPLVAEAFGRAAARSSAFELMLRDRDRLAHLITRGNGKSIADAEVAYAAVFPLVLRRSGPPRGLGREGAREGLREFQETPGTSASLGRPETQAACAPAAG